MNGTIRLLPCFLLVVMLFTFVSPCGAQLNQLRLVDRPELLESEFVGASNLDANGRICSAVKVVSDMEGFKYDSYNNVVKVDDQPGQDLVYLSPDERVLQIFHSGFEPLKLILSEVGIALQERRIWEIKVAGDAKPGEVAVTVLTNPPGAEVFIDEVSRGEEKKHTVSVGNHTLRLIKPGYEPMNTTIYADEKNNFFEYTLNIKQEVNIQIESEPSGALVYLDGLKLGTTPVSSFYASGRYAIRIEKEWYVPYEDYLDIQPAMGRKRFSLQPDFGELTIASRPQSSLEIYLNDRAQNVQTPHTFQRLAPGTYRIKAKSAHYETVEQEIALARGEKKTVELVSEASFAVLTIRTRPGATVYLNGSKVEQLENIRLEPSVVVLRAEMAKAPPVERRLTLRKGAVETVELLPQVPVGTIQVAVVPFDAKVELRGDAGESFSSVGARSFSDVPVGSYTLKVSLSGYADKQETLVLKEGEKLTRSVTLEKAVVAVSPPAAGSATGTWRDPKTGIEFVLVRGGSFDMGDTFGDGQDDEKPVHRVTVGDFYLGKTEVTVGQYRAFCSATGRSMPDAPSWGWQDNHPIVRVTWKDATAFCKWAGLRLPIEAEWEYAAREGGKKVKWSGTSIESQLGDYAWYNSNSGRTTHAVAGKKANSLGLYDMSGNVWEWCADWYASDYYQESPSRDPQGPSSGEYRVLRGGSWGNNPGRCRASSRGRNNPDGRANGNGFRVARPAQ
ncbi:MAG TPA: formylglycine-generating enzyme family protein [bacterium]|nr:formylglycine-generating enzyme family protein [bacterium]